MSERNSTSHDRSPGEVYQRTRTDGPGAALDAAILAQAEEAVAPRRRPAWLAPLGLAATVLLGVNLAVSLKDYSNEEAIFSDSVASVPSVAVESAPRSESAPESEADMAPVADTMGLKIEQHAQEKATAEKGRKQRAEAEALKGSELAVRPDEEIDLYAGFSQPAPSPVNEPAEAVDQAVDIQVATESAPVVAREKPVAPSTVGVTSDSGIAQKSPNPSAGIPRDRAQRDAIEVQNGDEFSDRQAERVQPALVQNAVASAPPPAMADRPWVADTDESLEEIVVTGSRMPERSDSPHRRLTAKGQVMKTQQNLENSTAGSTRFSLAEDVVASPDLYECDPGALNISIESVEDAKTQALTAQPPLTVLTWPERIRQQFEAGQKREACENLAAFRQLYPDLLLIEPLPLALPAEQP